MLFREQPNLPWTEFDFLLVEAWQMLQDETCSQCGNPIWICRNDSASNVGFKVKTSVCYATAELDKWREKEDKRKVKRKAYGESPYVIPYTYDDSPLPTRSQYLNSLSDKIE
nr:MAG TPA: hypothetical protein [Caudoviricetes sp.]